MLDDRQADMEAMEETPRDNEEEKRIFESSEPKRIFR